MWCGNILAASLQEQTARNLLGYELMGCAVCRELRTAQLEGWEDLAE